MITVCPVSTSGPRVLLIEPHRALREALVELMRSAGMTVTTATDRASVASLTSSGQPTVAVIDPHQQYDRDQPRAGLLAVLHAADPHLPVVVHSAMFAPGTLPRPERFHAVAIVPKGSDPDTLLTAIRHAHEQAPGRELAEMQR